MEVEPEREALVELGETDTPITDVSLLVVLPTPALPVESTYSFLSLPLLGDSERQYFYGHCVWCK